MKSSTPFDLATGPLVRAHLVALSDTHHHLIITAHHIVCDGWSIDVIMRDTGAIYNALCAGTVADLPAPLSIVDYARAEAEWDRSDEATQVRDYWLSKFDGPLPVLDLPTDQPRQATAKHPGRAYRYRPCPRHLVARSARAGQAQRRDLRDTDAGSLQTPCRPAVLAPPISSSACRRRGRRPVPCPPWWAIA